MKYYIVRVDEKDMEVVHCLYCKYYDPKYRQCITHNREDAPPDGFCWLGKKKKDE